MHRLAPRLLGLLLLLASGGTTVLHRAIYAAAGPAQALELAIGLTTFLLASVGILLLIHGAALFARTAPGSARTASGSARAAPGFARTTPGLTPDTRSRKREPEA